MNIHMQKHPVKKETNIVTKNRSISKTSEASSMEVAVTGMICEMKTKWAKPPTLLAALEKCKLAGIGFTLLLHLLLGSYELLISFCVRRRSVSNCHADGFVIPSAYCASLETHRSKVWHCCIFSFTIITSILVLLSPELGNFSTK